jgi:hypothetical protein
MADSRNTVDFIRSCSFVPFEWRSLGGVFARNKGNDSALSARVGFVVRKGYDKAEDIEYGTVLEGDGSFGVTLKSKDYAFNLSATGVSYHSGVDEPVRTQAISGAPIPGLKFTFSKQVDEEAVLAASYDFKQRRPELSVCWTGETFTDKASMVVSVDPVDRRVRLRAGLSTPGPEWRVTVYDEERDVVEHPADDGARHRLYVEHEACGTNLMARTRLGARLDLGRIVNYAADFVDYNVQPRIPALLWRVPLMGALYRVVVPAEDEQQLRHRISGWDLQLEHDFERSRPKVGLAKRIKGAELAVAYDLEEEAASASLDVRGARVVAQVGRQAGGWGNPSLHFVVEPLALL